MHKLNAKVSLIHRFGNNGVMKNTATRLYILLRVSLESLSQRPENWRMGFRSAALWACRGKKLDCFAHVALATIVALDLSVKAVQIVDRLIKMFFLHYVRHYLQILLNAAIINGFWIRVLKELDNHLKEILKTIWHLFLPVDKKEIILLTDLVVQSSNMSGHLFCVSIDTYGKKAQGNIHNSTTCSSSITPLVMAGGMAHAKPNIQSRRWLWR